MYVLLKKWAKQTLYGPSNRVSGSAQKSPDKILINYPRPVTIVQTRTKGSEKSRNIKNVRLDHLRSLEVDESVKKDSGKLL